MLGGVGFIPLVSVYSSLNGRLDLSIVGLEVTLFSLISLGDVLLIVGGKFNLDVKNQNIIIFVECMSSLELVLTNSEAKHFTATFLLTILIYSGLMYKHLLDAILSIVFRFLHARL